MVKSFHVLLMTFFSLFVATNAFVAPLVTPSSSSSYSLMKSTTAAAASKFSSGKLFATVEGEKKEEDTKETEGKESGEEEIEWKGAELISAKTKDVQKIFDVEHIAKVLPHRYPFLLVDKVVEYEAGKRAVGVKTISMNEPQFTGHFPERPIMPGVLMVEAMAQLGGVVALQMEGLEGKLFFFAGIDGVKFKRPVVPGDTLVMEMEMTKYLAKFGIAKFTGKAYVDGEVAVDVKEFTFAVQK